MDVFLKHKTDLQIFEVAAEHCTEPQLLTTCINRIGDKGRKMSKVAQSALMLLQQEVYGTSNEEQLEYNMKLILQWKNELAKTCEELSKWPSIVRALQDYPAKFEEVFQHAGAKKRAQAQAKRDTLHRTE